MNVLAEAGPFCRIHAFVIILLAPSGEPTCAVARGESTGQPRCYQNETS